MWNALDKIRYVSGGTNCSLGTVMGETSPVVIHFRTCSTSQAGMCGPVV